MPRKTRKQKERAAERLVKGEFEFKPELFSRGLKARKIPKRNEKTLPFYNSRLIVRDLAKTLLIALGIFSLEIVVYLLWFEGR